MTDLSSYLKYHLLQHVLRNEYFVPPANIYVALFNFPTTDDDVTPELDKGGYARQPVFFEEPDGSYESVSTTELLFGPASENWGEITHFALYDAPVGGNMLLHGPVDDADVVDAGQTYVFEPAGVIVTFQ